MRIALVCPYAYDDPGGVQTHVRELSERLTRRGHDVAILAPVRDPAPVPGLRAIGRPVDIPYNRSNAPIDPRPWHRRAVRRALADLRPDVVHAHEPFTPSTSMWATLESPAPVVATFHSGASRAVLFDLAAPVLRHVARRLAARIAVSHAAAAFVGERIPGEIEIVPNGVDVDRFRDVAPADLGPGTKLLFLGRLDPRKGFRVAIEAFARLARDRPDLRLVVIGDGPERAALDALAPQVRERVRMLGAVPNAGIPPFLAACDVYLGTSVGGESFGVVLVEAMAAGLPIVASRIAGYSEVARDGVEALLVPPDDPAALATAAARVLDAPDLADRLRSSGRDRAGTYDWSEVVTALEAVYARVSRSGPSSLR